MYGFMHNYNKMLRHIEYY